MKNSWRCYNFCGSMYYGWFVRWMDNNSFSIEDDLFFHSQLLIHSFSRSSPRTLYRQEPYSRPRCSCLPPTSSMQQKEVLILFLWPIDDWRFHSMIDTFIYASTHGSMIRPSIHPSSDRTVDKHLEVINIITRKEQDTLLITAYECSNRRKYFQGRDPKPPCKTSPP